MVSKLQAREDAAFAARLAAYERNPRLYLIVGWTGIVLTVALYVGLFVAALVYLKPVGEAPSATPAASATRGHHD